MKLRTILLHFMEDATSYVHTGCPELIPNSRTLCVHTHQNLINASGPTRREKNYKDKILYGYDVLQNIK